MRSSPERAVELRLSKICRRLAQNLVGLPQLSDLALERLHLVGNLGRDTRPLAAVDFSLLYPLMQRRRRAANLLGNRYHRRPARWIIPLVIQHHPDRSLAYLRRKLVRRFAHSGSFYSRVGASGKPGAVQTASA